MGLSTTACSGPSLDSSDSDSEGSNSKGSDNKIRRSYTRARAKVVMGLQAAQGRSIVTNKKDDIRKGGDKLPELLLHGHSGHIYCAPRDLI